MSTVALPGISARYSIFALGPKGPRANMELPGRYAWKRDGGHVIISKYSVLVRLMTSISKGKNTPIVLKDKISLKSKLIYYAILFRLSSLPKSVASYCKMGR